MFPTPLVPITNRVRRGPRGGAADNKDGAARGDKGQKTLTGLSPGLVRTQVVHRMLAAHGLPPTALGNVDKVTTQQLVDACKRQLLAETCVGVKNDGE